MKLNYLSETEAKMPLELALMQIVFGIKSCVTNGDVVLMLEDAVELGRREVNKKGGKQ